MKKLFDLLKAYNSTKDHRAASKIYDEMKDCTMLSEEEFYNLINEYKQYISNFDKHSDILNFDNELFEYPHKLFNQILDIYFNDEITCLILDYIFGECYYVTIDGSDYDLDKDLYNVVCILYYNKDFSVDEKR